MTVAGTAIHFYCGGEGPPLLLVHSGEGNPGWLMHHTAFAEHFRVYTPTHPGFGRFPLPDWIALDLFLLTPLEVRAATFHNPHQVPEWQRLYGQAPTPDDIDRQEAALETMVRLCWKPYMHNPRLPFLLPRLTCPTLIVWGRHDAIMPLECGEMYQRAIADARLETMVT